MFMPGGLSVLASRRLASALDPYYPFLIADIRPNSAGTAMIDHSAYGWTVTEVGAGAITYDADKATFDGTNYLTVDIDPALLSPGDVSQLTVEVSCSAGTAATSQYFVYAGTTSSQVWSVAAYAGNAESYRNNGSGGRLIGAALSNGTRVDLKLLVNKTAGLLLSDNAPNSASSYAASTFGSGTIDKLYIGESPTAAPVLTSGSEIYRVRIYRGVLRHPIAVPTEAFPDPAGDANVEVQLSFDGSVTDESDNAYTFTGAPSTVTSNPKFGSGHLSEPVNPSDPIETTLTAAYGTGDYGVEGWFSPTDTTDNWGLLFIVGNTWLYRAKKTFDIWVNNSSLQISSDVHVFTDGIYRHYYYAKKNNIGILWVDGQICLFWADTINNTGTDFKVSSIGSNSFYGDIDEVRLTNSGDAHVPTLMRDEDLPGDLSADNPANFFAQLYYTGADAESLIFTAQDLSSIGAMVLNKNRDLANNPVIVDTERGATKEIYTNATSAEATGGSGLTSFDDGGFSVGASSLFGASGYKYTSEVFMAALSESVTVDSQSFTLKHSGKGFGMIEIDRSLGGASGTITIDISAMGLASAPMVVVKSLDSAFGWYAWHPGLTAGYFVALHLSDAEANSNAATLFGNNSVTVDPTTSAITLGYSVVAGGNGSTAGADRIIVYVFGEVSTDPAENYIKLFSFSHTSGQSSYVDCGWHPRLSVCKASSTTGDWVTRNSTRGTGLAIPLNSATAEATDYGAHGPFGLELNGTYAVTGTIIGMAAR